MLLEVPDLDANIFSFSKIAVNFIFIEILLMREETSNTIEDNTLKLLHQPDLKVIYDCLNGKEKSCIQ
jgi:hypothetical protein